MKIKAVYLGNASDFKVNDKGEIELKRKYGKFTRPIYKVKTHNGTNDRIPEVPESQCKKPKP